MKNNIFKTLIAFLLIGFLFISCDKDQTNTTNNSKIKLFTYNNGLKTNVTMLEFADWDEYHQTIDFLEDEVNSAINDFAISHYTTNLDFYNYIIDSLDFDEHELLINFENNLNFTNSMRKLYRNLENIWLDNDSLIDENNPKIKYPFIDSEMTLLNEYGEVKIGEGIFKVLNDGYIYITDGDLATLAKFNDGDKSVLTADNVITNLETPEGDCDYWKNETNSRNWDGNKKVYYHLHYHSYLSHMASNSELTSFRKNTSNGHWRRWTVDMTVGNTTNSYDRDCTFEKQNYSPDKIRRSSNLNNRIFSLTDVLEYKCKNGASVYGHFYWGPTPLIQLDILSW